MIRPVTASLLASAIEYAAEGKLMPLERQRMFLAHYDDEAMETARHEADNILRWYNWDTHPLPKDAVEQLRAIAARLRARPPGQAPKNTPDYTQ